MKKNMLYLLVASFSISSLNAHTNLIKAVKSLNIAKVEHELHTSTSLRSLEKAEALKEIDVIIQQNKQKQASWRKYVNKNIILGSVSLALCVTFSIVFAEIIPKHSDSSEEEVVTDSWKKGYRIGFADGSRLGVVRGGGSAIFSTASGLIAANQLYKSFTGQHLKESYKSTLAIKQLLESTPVKDSEQPLVN